MEIELGLDRFVRWFKAVVREFYYLNDHYDTHKNSYTDSYDKVFARWKRDIYNKYKHMILHMHWVTDSHLVAENQVVLNVMFRSAYLFELKYKFGDQININFSEYLDKFRKIAESFMELADKHDFAQNQLTKDFDARFKQWKQDYYVSDDDIIVDMAWKTKEPNFDNNTLYLNIMYKDEYMFQVKYMEKFKLEDIDEISEL